MNLEQLTSGKTAIIKSITANGNLRKRLLLLGFAPGKTVTMIKSAPLKDPLEISLGHGHFSVCRQEAVLIQLEPVDGNTDE